MHIVKNNFWSLYVKYLIKAANAEDLNKVAEPQKNPW